MYFYHDPFAVVCWFYSSTCSCWCSATFMDHKSFL